MKYILIILLLFNVAKGQSSTITLGDTCKVFTYSQRMRLTGFLQFNGTTFVRSGDQSKVYQTLFNHIKRLEKQNELMLSILETVDTTGNVLYPIEYKEACRKYFQQNMRL